MKDCKSGFRLRSCGVFLLITAALVINGTVFGYSPGMRSAMVGGPWEITVGQGMGGQTVRFPFEVDNENKPADLDRVLPVMGSAAKIRILKYIPDLQWKTYGVKSEDGSVVLQLAFSGPKLDTKMWLDSSNFSKRAITSSIGGLMAIEVFDAKKLGQVAKELCDSEAVGIVSVWLKESKVPLQFVAKKGKVVSVGGSDYKLEILDFYPHYTVDRVTKEVVNGSEKPSNPALKVKMSSEGKEFEQWLWSKFPSSPHSEVVLPVRVEFTYASFGTRGGSYLLVGSKGSEPLLISVKNKKRRVEKLELKKAYPMVTKEYNLAIEEYIDSGKLVNEWENGSFLLKNPAIIVEVEKGDRKTEHVLELNKSATRQDGGETMVVTFARKGAGRGSGMGIKMPPGMGGMKKK